MRRFLLMLAVLCLVTWGTVFYLFSKQRDQATAALPTLMVLPSLTPSDTPTRTPSATNTPTATTTVSTPRWEGRTMTGADYFIEHAIPNFFFHATTAYSILRHNGVNLGKKDYLGQLTQKPPA